MLLNLWLSTTHIEFPSKSEKLYINDFLMNILCKWLRVEPSDFTLSSLKKISSVLPLPVKYWNQHWDTHSVFMIIAGYKIGGESVIFALYSPIDLRR